MGVIAGMVWILIMNSKEVKLPFKGWNFFFK